jgi:hypothetical protein
MMPTRQHVNRMADAREAFAWQEMRRAQHPWPWRSGSQIRSGYSQFSVLIDKVEQAVAKQIVHTRLDIVALPGLWA